jgi:hypothetical protein
MWENEDGKKVEMVANFPGQVTQECEVQAGDGNFGGLAIQVHKQASSVWE